NAFALAVNTMIGRAVASSATDGPTYMPHDADVQLAGTVGGNAAFRLDTLTAAVSDHTPAAPVQSPVQRANDDVVSARIPTVGRPPPSSAMLNPTLARLAGTPSCSGGSQLEPVRQFESHTSQPNRLSAAGVIGLSP